MPFPNFTDPKELQLYLKALQGDEEACKIYCGSYMLVRKLPVEWRTRTEGKLFRYKGDKAPSGYVQVLLLNGKNVHDKDGFLMSQFWSLPRVGE